MDIACPPRHIIRASNVELSLKGAISQHPQSKKPMTDKQNKTTASALLRSAQLLSQLDTSKMGGGPAILEEHLLVLSRGPEPKAVLQRIKDGFPKIEITYLDGGDGKNLPKGIMGLSSTLFVPGF